MKNLKVMEAAYNFTDAVIENKEYTIERGYNEKTYWISVGYEKSKTGIAMYDAMHDIFVEKLPIRYAHQQQLVLECLKYDSELQAAEQREKELKEEFEAWRAKNGK